MIFVYLAAPVYPLAGSSETREDNLELALTYYRQLSRVYQDHAFQMPWWINCKAFDETPENIALGMKRNTAVINLLADHDFVAQNKAAVPYIKGRPGAQLWLVGPRVSEGMFIEATYARGTSLAVKRLAWGVCPPPIGALVEWNGGRD